MYDYIKADPRYVYLKGKRRQTIFAWTQREYRNLLKAREAGARVPKPIAFKDNIILMELIGEGIEAAPELKDAFPEKPDDFFKKIVENIKKMWDAGLVHGDLSAFNILNFKENPVFIDFSQSTITTNQRAQELLERDVKNVCLHFKKSGINPNQQSVLDYITSKTRKKDFF